MKSRKRLIYLLLAITIMMALPFTKAEARSPEKNIKIWIDDFYIMSDVHPFVENNRTFVPIRFIAEELGYNVDWHPDTREVTIESEGSKAILEIGSDELAIDGEISRLDSPAQIKEDRTFVPFRLVAELFGEEVEYDEANKVAIIGEDYEVDTYYPLKYFLNNEDPFITTYKINFLEYIVRFSDGRIVNLESDEEVLDLVDKEGILHEKVNFKTEVEDDKQLYDKHYVAPIKEDPFVGSWYGTNKTTGTQDYYDKYVYIEKIDDNKYLYKQRSIKENGSELMTESYASYDKRMNVFRVSRSHKTTYASGEFDYNWYTNHGTFKVENFNYMYIPSDPKLNVKKY